MDAVSLFILDQEEPQQEVLAFLHDLIVAQFPELEAKIRYKIPFYYRKSWICYLNPTKGGKVEFAFIRGNELSNEQGLLDFRGRKQVGGITIGSVSEIPVEPLLEVLAEAVLLDEAIPYAPKRR